MATRTIGTELVLTGEKEFNQQMKAVNAGLKTTRSDMAALTSSFGDNANSMEALTAKQKLLQTSVAQHQEKVNALTKQYKAAAKQYGENEAITQKYKQQLNQATVALTKETAALDANAEAMKAKRLAALTALGNGTKKVLSGVGTAAAKTGEFVGKAAAAAAAGVAAIGAAAGVAFAGIVSMATEAAEAAKAAAEAGEELTADQQRWLAFSGQLDSLRGSATNAKSAIAGILLPVLGDLATEGTDFLNRFTADMSSAAGDTEKQTEILGQYIAEGAKLILSKLPEYIQSGKEILSGVGAGLSEAAPEMFDMAEDLLSEFLNFIITKAPELAEGGLEMVLQLIEGINGQNLADTASNLVGRLVNMLAEYAPKLIPAAVKLIGEFAVGLAKNAPMLLESGFDLLMGLLDGILSGLGQIPEICLDLIDAFIDGIANAWGNLASWFNGLWDNLFSGRDVDVNVNASGTGIDGSHASGLRYVPFDGYLAQLHRGEAVLPAEEAAAYRSGNTGGKVFNLTINPKSVSKEDLDMLVEYINGKLGDGL
jgi:hypothetical protein